MQQLHCGLKAARERTRLLAEVMRWVWLTNAVVMIAGVMEKRWELAAVAGITWVMTLVAAAVAKRVDLYLGHVERIVQDSCADVAEIPTATREPLVRLKNQ